MLKSIQEAFHALVKTVLHVLLIPAIAVLKAIDAFCVHLISELTRV